MSDKLEAVRLKRALQHRDRVFANFVIDPTMYSDESKFSNIVRHYQNGIEGVRCPPTNDCHDHSAWKAGQFHAQESLRTPTPEQAGEVEQIIRWVDQAIERAGKHGNTEGIWLFAKQWKTVRAALQSTPPAQPTADAVERREAIARIVERSIGTAQRSAITGDCDEDYRHALIAADDILALPTTMAGDYVMARADALAQALCLLDTFAGEGLTHIYGNGQVLDAADVCAELAEAYGIECESGWWRTVADRAASPTGGK